MGINYKTQRILYDITQLDEKLDGRTLFRFARRVLPREASELPLSNGTATGEPNFDDEETPTPCDEAPAEGRSVQNDGNDAAVSTPSNGNENER